MFGKHKRAARITANEGGHKLKITVDFQSDNCLTLDEVRKVRTKMARAIR